MWKNLLPDYFLQLSRRKTHSAFQQGLENNVSLRKADYYLFPSNSVYNISYPAKNNAWFRSPGYSKVNLWHSYLKTILNRKRNYKM